MITKFKKIFFLILVSIFGLAFSGSVFAADCPVRLQITYADGENGCLSDLPISKEISKEWGKSIESVAQYAPNYTIIAGDTCNVTEIIRPEYNNNNYMFTTSKNRVDALLRNCPKNCNCAVVVESGRVLLKKNIAMAIGSSRLNNANLQNTATVTQTVKETTTTQSIKLPLPEIRKNESQALDQNDRQKDRELLLQISAELTRLKAENEAVKEDQKVLAQALASATGQQSNQVFVNRKALVIGNDNYKFVAKLATAKEDAKTMAESLASVGYQVTVKYDLTERELKTTLRNFKDKVEPGDEVAVFYAGHGVQLANSNFLLPIDVDGEGEDQIKDEAISLQRILDDVASKKAKFTLAMIDACRDNPFKNSGRSLAGISRGLAPTTAATGQMIIFSAGTGQRALDSLGPNDKNKNGVFTRVFAQEMKKPGISIDRVARNVRVEVVNLAKSAGHEQVPAIYDQVVGEFYFRK